MGKEKDEVVGRIEKLELEIVSLRDELDSVKEVQETGDLRLQLLLERFLKVYMDLNKKLKSYMRENGDKHDVDRVFRNADTALFRLVRVITQQKKIARNNLQYLRR